MADTVLTIPDKPARHGYFVDITTALDAGNDVVFKDTSGNEINCSYMDCASNATLKTRTRHQTDAQAETQFLVKGGWHQVTASKAYTAGHTASATLRARFV